jgi:hypothetical protein
VTAPRCRWHTDDGRCPGVPAAPGAADVPELCAQHLALVERWATRAQPVSDAGQWIAWAARRARDTEDAMRALGMIAPLRAVIPASPERR